MWSDGEWITPTNKTNYRYANFNQPRSRRRLTFFFWLLFSVNMAVISDPRLWELRMHDNKYIQ